MMFHKVFQGLLSVSLCFLLISGCGKSQKLSSDEQAAEGANSWQVIGPGGGGAQFEPTISPHDPDNVFVRCDMTGAYVSLDGGGSWRMFNLRTVVRDFEFDPNNPGVVYAANNGLYRSENRGGVWSLIYPDPKNITGELMMGDHAGQRFVTTGDIARGSISRVRVDPMDSNHLYLGMTAGRRGGSCRLLVSTDRGANWKVLAEVPGSAVLGIFPGAWDSDPDGVTVITNSTCARVSIADGKVAEQALPVESVSLADGGKSARGSVLYVLASARRGSIAGDVGVFRSTDRGASWQPACETLFGELPADSRPPMLSTLAVCESRPEVVYLSCRSFTVTVSGNPQRQSGILKTEDSGKTWQWVLKVMGGDVLTENFNGGWLKRCLGWFGSPSHLGVAPGNPAICYGTDSGRTIRTTDGGAHWEQVISKDFPDGSFTTRGLDVTTNYGVHFDPYNKDHYFISYTDIGLFHTYNSGKSWLHSIVGIPRQWRNTCYWLEFDPAVKGRVWSVWSNVHDLPRPKMHRSGNLVNGRQQGGVALSGDGGRSWGLSVTGVREDGEYRRGLPAGAVCTHITIDHASPVNSRTLYVCEYGRGVYKSTDAGRTWELKAEGLGENRKAWRTALLPDGGLFLLIARGGLEGRGYVDGGLFLSRDGADSWQQVPLPKGVNAPNDLVYDPSDPRRMYLSCWPWNADNKGLGGGLLRTEDGGKTWRQVFDEQAHVYAAAVDPKNPSTLYLNTFDSGAYRSDDRGESWTRLGGYNFKWGHRPVLDPHNPGMLFLTTFGGSVYYGPAAGVPGAVEDIENLPPFSW
jgi:photosystem II stability/assembly factor-like uncharacterized protein